MPSSHDGVFPSAFALNACTGFSSRLISLLPGSFSGFIRFPFPRIKFIVFTMQEQQTEIPKQEQARYPGLEQKMQPHPRVKGEWYRGSGKLEGRTALITGGDSGIGQAIAVFFAREGAQVAVAYLDEHADARETKRLVEEEKKRCHLIPGDITQAEFSRNAVEETLQNFGRLDVLINNAAYGRREDTLDAATPEELEKIFRTNIFAHFYMAKAAVPYMKKGAAIINTTSVTAYRGSGGLLSYSSTKGAIVSFTRSLSKALIKQGIRVNGVAPGPVWTPLIPATSSANSISDFGMDVPMKRPAHPEDIAPSYVFLASRDSEYMTGQVLHPNGGEIFNT